MRRWIALLLIALLPLQVSWSVAAEYGHHGATLAAPHAEMGAHGHAQHDVHEGSKAGAEAEDAASERAEAPSVCCDLHQCHAHGSFAALTSATGLVALAALSGYATEPAGQWSRIDAVRIERPKWTASPITC